MGDVGWSTVANLANTETGQASGAVAQATSAFLAGRGVGGATVITNYIPTPTGFIVLPSAGAPSYSVTTTVLDSAGTSYTVSTTVRDSAGTAYTPI